MSEEPFSMDTDEWLPSKILLVDQSPPLVEAWKNSFARFANVSAHVADYFQIPADAIVSPANSFGIMDGGIDLAIRDCLGYGIESKVQTLILNQYHGEMPIGCAEIVETGSNRFPFLVCAPTMRIPERVARSLNAYLAFRAILLACAKWNQSRKERLIDTLLCCGLATGVGGMEAKTCAGQMVLAYKSILLPPVIGRFESIHDFHRTLRSM